MRIAPQPSSSGVDTIIVAVATNSSKQPLFSVEERVELIRASIGDLPGVQVRSFGGLLVDFARDAGARLLIRGLRAVSDFEYEYQMALMNRHLSPDLETVLHGAFCWNPTYIQCESLSAEVYRAVRELSAISCTLSPSDALALEDARGVTFIERVRETGVRTSAADRLPRSR